MLNLKSFAQRNHSKHASSDYHIYVKKKSVYVNSANVEFLAWSRNQGQIYNEWRKENAQIFQLHMLTPGSFYPVPLAQVPHQRDKYILEQL